MSKIKILYFGSMPTAYTAYAKNTANICLRLKEKHEIAILAHTGYFFGQPLIWNGIPILSRKTIYGNGTEDLESAFKKMKADLVFQHFDIWACGDYFAKTELPYMSLTPVDHTTEPGGIGLSEHIIKILKNARMNCAMSHFADESFKKAGLKSHYCPHGYSPEMYFPINKEFARKTIGFKDYMDKFIFGGVMTNKGPRKNLFGQLRAFKMFLDANPDAKKDAMFYLHTYALRDMVNPTGYNLFILARQLGIQDNVKFSHPDVYWNIPEEKMKFLYNSFDCLMQCTMGEGMGLPIIESFACGIPVISTDFGATKELVEDVGLLVKVKEWVSFELVDAWFALPDTEHIADCMGKMYNSEELRKKCSEKGIEKAKEYDWDVVIHNIEDAIDEAIKKD